MIDVSLCAAGVLGPGLPDWPATRAVLRGETPYAPASAAEPACTLLPANERRRVSRSVRWALAVGQEVLAAQHSDGADIATVFASCGGDGAITHQICEALATPAREVSPTRFHNSVHNAPAGYWSIATGSTMPSTSLCAYQATFAAGLLEAAAQVRAENHRVLLIVYDLPYPQPMHALWPVEHPLAVALLLDPACGKGARLRLATGTGAAEPEWPRTLPRQLASNPASHALPLLAALALGCSTQLRLPYLGDCHLAVEIGT
jgi:hypothetical protein